ncbi:MAG TPA: dihydrolipoamide acetyltransferase family protein [Humibacter sp.]|nr:dihydrolipoamide acetyltransferase family protein [Humibacter sp.]
MSVKDFALPDLGEGLEESEIVSWHIEPGDTVELNQIIAEVETAKALVELPSPYAGTVRELYVEPGSTVRVGAPIVAFELDDSTGNGADAPLPQTSVAEAPDAAAGSASPRADRSTAPAEQRQSVLVGRGPALETGERPHRRPRRTAASPGSAVAGSPTAASSDPIVDGATASGARRPAERPRSTPPVRALARELGVDLGGMTGTGERGLITRDDVRNAAKATNSSHLSQPMPADGPSADRVTRVPIAGMRKHTAAAMVTSAFTAPHVTEFLTVDVTPTMDLIAALAATRAFRERRLTPLAVVAKALCIAVARTPEVNAHWDEAAGEIVRYGFVNLGIAAATPRGLLVPNIKDADSLALPELADALAELTVEARAGRTTPAALSGGTITITNIGVFGVDAGTPILNPGEAAILAMGAVQRRPWEFRGEIALRKVMTLSLSFDHRLVDGEQGSRFLADIGAILAEPGTALAMV